MFHLMCIPLLSVMGLGCTENTLKKHCPLEHLLHQGEQPLGNLIKTFTVALPLDIRRSEFQSF